MRDYVLRLVCCVRGAFIGAVGMIVLGSITGFPGSPVFPGGAGAQDWGQVLPLIPQPGQEGDQQGGLENEQGTQGGDQQNQDDSIFEILFDEPAFDQVPEAVFCADYEVVNPGFGFGAQDFNLGCPDQIILKNIGLDRGAYELTEVRTDPPTSQGVAVLQALDKITGRLTGLEIRAGEQALFETLVIEASACFKNPETETPENAAFLKIFDQIDGLDQQVFSGWMYASSPSLSAMEHAIYDVWVVDCKN